MSEQDILDSVSVHRQPLSRIVADQIMKWIVEGKLKAGEKIRSETLAKKLGVSRTPVREAFRILEENGILVNTPYVGTSVNTLKMDDINEIYTLRELLETFIITPIMENIQPEDITELEKYQLHIEEEIHASPRNNMRIYELNKAFHMRMYAISKMPRLCGMIDSLWSNLAFARLFFANKETYGDTIETEHRSYIEALRKRDAKSLKQLRLSNLLNHDREIHQFVEQYNNGAVDR